MRRTQRVTEQHHVSNRPPFVSHIWEVAPYGFVGYETVPSQGLGEDVFTVCKRSGVVHPGEADACPRRGITLENECAQLRRMPVVVGVEVAVLVLDEGLRQRREELGRAEPGELVGLLRDRRAEI